MMYVTVTILAALTVTTVRCYPAADGEVRMSVVEEPRWPTGSYGLIETTDGCPGTDKFWDHILTILTLPGLTATKPEGTHLLMRVREGKVLINLCARGASNHQHNVTNSASYQNISEILKLPEINHFEPHMPTGNQLPEVKYEISTANGTSLDEEAHGNWPPGKYCVIKVFGEDCPLGLESGHFRQTFRSGSSHYISSRIGENVMNNVTRLDFCCSRQDQPEVEITLPTKVPFTLLPVGTKTCQSVTGMTSHLESMTLPDTALQGKIDVTEPHGYFTVGETGDVTLFVCYYHEDRKWQLFKALGGSDRAIVVGASCSAGLVVLIVFLGCVLKRRKRPHRRLLRQLRLSSKDKNCYIRDGKVWCNETMQTETDARLGCLLSAILSEATKEDIQPLLIPGDFLTLHGKIGEGAYGTVMKATYSQSQQTMKRTVAVKTCKVTCSNEDVMRIIDEALLMSQLNHRHLLGIIGISLDEALGLPMLVMTYMYHGDLQTYLRRYRYDEEYKEKVIPENTLLCYVWQIATGMEYLANKKWTHRDLALRNCMLSEDNVVRIADFGLARDVYMNSYYRQTRDTRLPIKWMAPESLHDRVFTIESDVWAFGVTVWEMFTLGKTPYPSLESADVVAFIDRGGRLEKPEKCPPFMYEMMLKCWNDTAKSRPSFTSMAEETEEHLMKDAGYLMVSCSDPDEEQDTGEQNPVAPDRRNETDERRLLLYSVDAQTDTCEDADLSQSEDFEEVFQE